MRFVIPRVGSAVRTVLPLLGAFVAVLVFAAVLAVLVTGASVLLNPDGDGAEYRVSQSPLPVWLE